MSQWFNIGTELLRNVHAAFLFCHVEDEKLRKTDVTLDRIHTSLRLLWCECVYCQRDDKSQTSSFTQN